MSQLKGVEISLKPIAGGVNRVLPPGLNQVMQQEYASRYLESIGAYATRENVEFVLTNLAIQDALVLPIWARSKVLIIPGMNNKDGIELGASIQDVLSDDYEYEEKVAEKKSVSKPTRADSVDGNNSMYPNLQTAYTCLVGRKLSWTTANTLDLVEPLAGVLAANKRIAESFKMLLRPPEFGTVDIQNALFTFITALPDYVPRVKYDTTFELFKSVRRLLKSKQCAQLYGLLIHFCYWNIIHPTVRHAIQTLREAQQDSDDASFRDVDLNANEATRLRTQGNPATVGSPPRPGQQSRTPMSLEKMFADEVFASEEGAQKLTLNIPVLHDKEASRGTSASPQRSGTSPLMREVTGLFQQPGGSKKVAFGVLSTLGTSNPSSRSASPTRQLETVDSGLYQSEERHDGSPVGSPLRGRAQSYMSELNGGPSPGPGGVGASGRSGYFDSSTRSTNEIDGYLASTGGSLGGASEETEASLSAAEKEQLFMQIEVCLLGLFKQVGHKRADLVTGRQAMVTCCHFVVDEILTAAYPWFATLPNTPQELEHAVHTPDYLDYLGHGRDWHGPYAEHIRQLNLRLRRLVHQGLADIIDPSRLYTSSMLLTTVTGKLQLTSLATKGRSRFYTTSAATKAVLGDSHSDAARRFIQQGRGVYTVLPGVVDAYSNRPSTSTGRLDATRKDFACDAMRDSHQRQQQTQLRDDDLQSLDSSVHRLDAFDDIHLVSPSAAGPRFTVHRSATEPAAPTSSHRISNRFPDNHARTAQSAHRPSTSTGVGGRQAARPGTTSLLRGGTQSGAARGASTGPAGGKRIDFQRLFNDQPDANYFPVIKARTSDAARAAQEAIARENDWLDQFLPAGSRASSATQPDSDGARPQVQRSRPSTSASARAGVSSGGATTARSGTATYSGTGTGTATSTRPSTAVSQYGVATASRPTTAASAFGSARAPDPGIAEAMQTTGSSGASVGSASYLTADNRSLAHNKAAPLELSLRAKATLMELMVNKTAALYSSEIQTDVVKTRVALLRKT